MEVKCGSVAKKGNRKMLNKIEIYNLKSISDLCINCKALNVFVGTNSSGKSTAIQSLLFLSQNLEKQVGLNSDLMRLGKFEDVRCRYTGEDSIRVGVTDEEQNYLYRMLTDRGECLRGMADEESEELRKRLDYYSRGLQYLSCNRVGPRGTYEKDLSLYETIGVNGEYAISYLNNHGQDVLENELCKNRQNLTLLGQVNWWLRYIVDTEIQTEEWQGANQIVASYQMGKLTRVSPQNIGAGISYLISILILCLSAKHGSTIIIENPEIHLHPKAQGRICEFLYFIASTQRQIFVESHSDHIFNGFRAGIASKKMERKGLSILFFSLNENYTTDVEEVIIGEYGRIENQRKDLFDQFDLDLNRMLGIE